MTASATTPERKSRQQRSAQHKTQLLAIPRSDPSAGVFVGAGMRAGLVQVGPTR